MTTLINPGTGPVAYDEAGHVLGGGERLENAPLDLVTKRAIELGHLRQLDEPAKTDKDSAVNKPAGADEVKSAKTGETKSAKTSEANPATPARRAEKS